MIPYGTQYTVKVTGSVWKPVQCTSCGTEFVYFLTRQASGYGTSVLWLDKDGATERARQRATKTLERVLRKSFDAVACPECGIYQHNMVCLLKKRKLRILRILSFLVLVCVIPIAESRGCDGARHDEWAVLTPPWVYVAGGAFLACGACWIIRWLYDPNIEAPSRAGQKPSGLEGPYRRAEFERLVAEAVREQKANRESPLVDFDYGNLTCDGCGQRFFGKPRADGSCPLCGWRPPA